MFDVCVVIKKDNFIIIIRRSKGAVVTEKRDDYVAKKDKNIYSNRKIKSNLYEYVQ